MVHNYFLLYDLPNLFLHKDQPADHEDYCKLASSDLGGNTCIFMHLSPTY